MKSKNVKVFRKFFAVILVFILCIENLAAIVSDNDGSAFVTKAEFEVMKNDFKGQVDKYNTSIDKKIDGAIAAYLAGIKLETSESLKNMIEEAYNNKKANVMFIQWKTPQATKNVNDVSAGFHCMYGWGGGMQDNIGSGGTYGYYGLCNGQSWSGSLPMVRYTNYTGVEADYTNAYYYASFPFGIRDDVNYITTGDTTNFTLSNVYRWRSHIDIRATEYGIRAAQASATLDAFDYAPTEIICDFTTNSISKNGPAVIDGPTIAMGTGFSGRPSMSITHTLTRTSSDATANDFLNYNLAGTISGSSSFFDFDYRNNYHQDGQVTLEIQRNAPQNSSEGIRSGTAVQVKKNGQAWSSATGRPGYNNNTSFKFKYNHQKIYDLNWANLTSEYYNSLFATPYYKYYGIPVCNTPTKEGKLKFKIEFTNSGSGNYTYELMDTRFPNGDMPTTKVEQDFERVLKRETLSGSGTKSVNIEISKNKIFDTSNGDYIYVKVVPAVSGDEITVRVPGDIVYTYSS